jgi:hypothetical protein
MVWTKVSLAVSILSGVIPCLIVIAILALYLSERKKMKKTKKEREEKDNLAKLEAGVKTDSMTKSVSIATAVPMQVTPAVVSVQPAVQPTVQVVPIAEYLDTEAVKRMEGHVEQSPTRGPSI